MERQNGNAAGSNPGIDRRPHQEGPQEDQRRDRWTSRSESGDARPFARPGLRPDEEGSCSGTWRPKRSAVPAPRPGDAAADEGRSERARGGTEAPRAHSRPGHMPEKEWARHLQMMKQGIEHHVQEEESKILPAAQRIVGDQSCASSGPSSSGWKSSTSRSPVRTGISTAAAQRADRGARHHPLFPFRRLDREPG